MIQEPEAMKEIHAIQEKIYEEQKSMSSKEKLEILHKEAKEAEEKFGMSLRKLGA